MSKVVFQLHPSFAIPVREVTEGPFEVTEVGWGEFEAIITIYFQDPNESPITLTHTIRLYPVSSSGVRDTSAKKPVMHEVYDEIIFVDPTPEFKQCLMLYQKPEKRENSRLSEYFTPFDDEEDIYRLSVSLMVKDIQQIIPP